MSKFPGDVLRDDDGEPMRVIRPQNPKLALALAKVSRTHADVFDRIPEEVGDYIYLGWLVKRGGKLLIVDNDGLNPKECEPGDSFVTMTDEALESMRVPKKE